MGSPSSKVENGAEYGQIYVRTDRRSYFGGESVTGQIHINLLKPFPGKQLLLRLQGLEIVHLVVSGNKDQHFKETNRIIDLYVPVYTWDSSPIVGQYTIPFSFILPVNLPTTFYQEGHRYLASLYYQLEAVLEPENRWIHPRLNYEQDLIVKSPPTKEKGKMKGRSLTTMENLCCQGGQNVLSAEYEKSLYFPEEIVKVIVSLDNTECKIDNKMICLSLRQRIKLNCSGHTHTREFIKGEARFSSGASKGQEIKDKMISLKLPYFQVGDHRSGERTNMRQYLLGLLESRNVIHSATNSKLIHSEYIIEVTCPMDDSFVKTPTLLCPIEICHPDIEIPEIDAPPDWNPVQMENANLVFAPPIDQVRAQNNDAGINMGSNNMNWQMSDEERASLYEPPPQFSKF